MNASCDVVRDLLPLYEDKVLSKDSSNLVEEHLKSCEECKKIYALIKAPVEVGTGEMSEGEVLRKASSGLKKKRKKWVTIASLATAAILVVILLIGFAGYKYEHYYFKERATVISVDLISLYGTGVIDDKIKYIDIECRTEIPKDMVGIYMGPGIIEDGNESGTTYIQFKAPRKCDIKEGEKFIQRIYYVEIDGGVAFYSSIDQIEEMKSNEFGEKFYIDNDGNPITRLVYIDDEGNMVNLLDTITAE